jgi:hypothetical protein
MFVSCRIVTHRFLWRRDAKQAHISGSYAIAFEAATEDLEGLTFNQGLHLILDSVDGDPLYYDALALVWLQKAIDERRFTLFLAGHAARNLHALLERDQAQIARRGLSSLLDPPEFGGG